MLSEDWVSPPLMEKYIIIITLNEMELVPYLVPVGMLMLSAKVSTLTDLFVVRTYVNCWSFSRICRQKS